MEQTQILDVVYVHTMNKPQLVHWHSRTHTHGAEQFEFHYFLHGDGSFKNDSTTRSIRSGYLYLTQPEQVHKIHTHSLEHPLGYYATLFHLPKGHEIHTLLTDPDFVQRFPCRLGASKRFFFDDLKNCFISGDPHLQQAGVYKLLSFICELYAGEVATRKETDRDFNILLEQAIALFQENLFRHTTLQEVHQKLGVSKEYLIRLFNRHLHTTPMRYFTKLKIEAAASMLIDSNLSLKEIAYELGFSSPFHLSKRFKEYTGITPSTYRKQYYRLTPTQYHTRLVKD
ncbi:MAG: AraC family transcriptional regulator [Spirochaeta sp.]